MRMITSPFVPRSRSSSRGSRRSPASRPGGVSCRRTPWSRVLPGRPRTRLHRVQRRAIWFRSFRKIPPGVTAVTFRRHAQPHPPPSSAASLRERSRRPFWLQQRRAIRTTRPLHRAMTGIALQSSEPQEAKSDGGRVIHCPLMMPAAGDRDNALLIRRRSDRGRSTRRQRSGCARPRLQCARP